jgi:hypothetical protein
MAPCIALDDFLRALARTPRRSTRRSQWIKTGQGNAFNSDGYSDRVVEASPERGPEALEGDAICVQAASQVGGGRRAVSKRKPAAESHSREKGYVGNKTKHVVESGDPQAQLPLGRKPRRNNTRGGQATPFRIRKGVVRKRRMPVNELVLVNSTADCEPIHGVHL